MGLDDGALRRHHTPVVHAEERPMVGADDGALTWDFLPPDDKSVVAPYSGSPHQIALEGLIK